MDFGLAPYMAGGCNRGDQQDGSHASGGHHLAEAIDFSLSGDAALEQNPRSILAKGIAAKIEQAIHLYGSVGYQEKASRL